MYVYLLTTYGHDGYLGCQFKVFFFFLQTWTRGPRAMVCSPEWHSHCRHADVPNNICGFSHKASSVLENKIFKCFFPYKCMGKQTCTTIILATLVDPLSPMIYAKIQPQGVLGFLKGLTIYGHGGHLGQWTATILAIFHSPNLRRLHMKFVQNWPWGSRGGRLKFWIFFPYKCIKKQNWPQGKKSNVNVRSLF